MAKLRRQLRVAADQRGRGEAVALGLQDMVVVDLAELADRAVHRADTKSASAMGRTPVFRARVKKSLNVA